MIIRKAKIKDIPQTVKHSIDLNKEHEKFDKYFELKNKVVKIIKEFHTKNIFSSRSLFLVAEDNDIIIAYVIVKIDKRPPVYKIKEMGYVLAIYVDKKYRKKGISKKFFEIIIPWFKKKKIKYIELQVHPKNIAGVKVWKKHKFKTFLLTQRKRL